MFGSKEIPSAEIADTIVARLASVRKPGAVQASEIQVTRLRIAREQVAGEFRAICRADNAAGVNTESSRLKKAKAELDSVDAQLTRALREMTAARRKMAPDFDRAIRTAVEDYSGELSVMSERLSAIAADLAAADDFAGRNELTVPKLVETWRFFTQCANDLRRGIPQ